MAKGKKTDNGMIDGEAGATEESVGKQFDAEAVCDIVAQAHGALD